MDSLIGATCPPSTLLNGALKLHIVGGYVSGAALESMVKRQQKWS